MPEHPDISPNDQPSDADAMQAFLQRVASDTCDSFHTDLTDFKEAISTFLETEYDEALTSESFGNVRRIDLAEANVDDRGDITLNVAIDLPELSIDQYVNGTKTDSRHYHNLRELVNELDHATYEKLIERGPKTEAYVERLLAMPQETQLPPGSSFALYQIKAGDENRMLRFMPWPQLREGALSFRAKVHMVIESMEDMLFPDKHSVEVSLRSKGFVIRPNADPGVIIVSDDMQHESTLYLMYGENCCRIDGCNTKALDTLVDASRYELVYSGSLPKDCAGISEPAPILESIFYQMNMRRPAGYLAPSMSVSDVVALTLNEQTTYYFTDSFGFQSLSDFAPKDQPLKNAEMAMEDDYDMIDGLINNGPKQEQKPERVSLIEQLKEYGKMTLDEDHSRPQHPRKDLER